MKSLVSLTRVYSLGNVLLITALALATSSVHLTADPKFILTLIMGILFWVACVFTLDFMHKSIDGREKLLNKYILLIPLALLIIIFLEYAPYAILIFIGAMVSVILYSMKSKSTGVSHLLFLFRPFTEIGIIYSAAMMYGIDLYYQPLLLLSAVVFLISSSRNIIGDARDAKFDKHTTLPRKVGVNQTYFISAVLLLILFLINGLNYALVPLVFILALLIFRLHPYILHRIYILCSGFFFALLLSQLGVSPMIITMLLLVTSLLNFTYNLTPRVSNLERPRWF